MAEGSEQAEAGVRPAAPRTLGELRAHAIAAHRAGELDAAFAAYRAYLQRRPRDSGIWTNLGALLRRRGEHLAAAACQRARARER